MADNKRIAEIERLTREKKELLGALKIISKQLRRQDDRFEILSTIETITNAAIAKVGG